MANEFKVKKGLIVNGSGSVILDVRGSQGQLFSVTDNLSGSLFSVADISGVPVFDVFSSGRVGIGTSNPAERLHVYGGNVLISGSSAGTELKVQDGASGAPIRLSSNGSGEAFLYIGGENSSLRRTGGDLNLFANSLDIKLSTNNGSTATLFLDTSHNATFAGSVKPSGNATKDLGGSSNRWATVYAANINTNSSSTFGHNIVLDDHVDHSPEIQFINQNNESWEIYNNSSGKLQIEQGGAGRVELSSGGLELKSAGRLTLQSGSASSPAITFLSASISNNGIYREAYTTGKSNISIATEGTRRVRINEAGLFSDVNVYVTGQFRSFTSPWHATQGTAGAGFRFENTADSRILFDIAGTGNSLLYTVSTMAPSLTFGATAGQRLRTENSEFAFGLSNVTPYPLFIQGRNHVNAARHIVLQPKGGNIGIGVDGSGAAVDTLLHLANSSSPVIKLERPGNAAIRLGVSGTDFAISRTSDNLSSGNAMIIDDAYNTTFSGSVRSNGLTTDGNAKKYVWRALENTSNTSNLYHRIARVVSGQSSRFIIELAGRSLSYSNGVLPAFAKIVGQLNNDNNYDLTYYDFPADGTTSAVDEVRFVDIDNSTADIYIKVGQFSEIVATAAISDGTITPVGGDSSSVSAPASSTVVTERTIWNSTSSPTFAGNINVGGGNALVTEHIKSNSSVRIDIDNDGNQTDRSFLVSKDNSGTELFRINEDGTVGIGTNNPSATLHIKDAANSGVVSLSTNGRIKLSGDGVITWGASANYGTLTWDTGKAIVSAQGSNRLHLATAGNSDVIVLNGANVGIGTTTPASFNSRGRNLVVNSSGDTGITIAAGSSDSSTLLFADGTGGTAAYRGIIEYDHASDYMAISTAATERMRIDSSGNLLIGKTANTIGGAGVVIRNAGEIFSTRAGDVAGFNRLSSDGNIVQFYKDGSVIGAIGCNSSGGNPVLDIASASSTSLMRFLTSNSERMRIDSSGNIGIGTTNPAGKVDIDGDLRITRNIVSNTQYEFMSFGSNRSIDDYGGLNKAYWKVGIITPGSSTTGESSAHGFGSLVFSGVTGANTTYANRMVIEAGGNVGIGTDNPSSKLHMGSNSASTAIDIGLQNNSRHYTIKTDSGNFKIKDESAAADRITLDSSGKVGIGTSPTANLEVGGAGSTLRVGPRYSSGGDRDFVDIIANGTDSKVKSDNERFHIENGLGHIILSPNDKVGIGTTAPARTLDIVGNLGLTGDIVGTGSDIFLLHSSGPQMFMRRSDSSISTDDRLGALLFQGDDPTDGVYDTGASITALASTNWSSNNNDTRLEFAVKNNATLQTGLAIKHTREAMFSDSIGIGVTPSMSIPTFTLGGSTHRYGLFLNAKSIGVVGKVRVAASTNDLTGTFAALGSGQFHALQSNTAYGQTGQSNGTVAITNDTGTTTTGIAIKNTSTGNTNTLFHIFRTNNTGTMGNFSSGVGSPTTLLKMTGQADLTVGINSSNSAVRAENFYSYAGGTTFYLKLNNSGTSLNARGDVVAFASSDIRMKEDIRPLENSLDKLDKIKGVKFKWNNIHKDFKGKEDIGVIAQDVEKVLPEIVTTRDTGYKAVDYQKLSVLLIESVKELKKEVEELKKKINN